MTKKNNHYIGIIKPIRKGFMSNPTKKEIEIMKNHFEYLQKLLATEELLLAGPAINKENPFGIIIFKAESQEKAKELLYNDPSVKSKVQKVVEFEPFNVSLLQKSLP